MLVFGIEHALKQLTKGQFPYLFHHTDVCSCDKHRTPGARKHCESIQPLATADGMNLRCPRTFASLLRIGPLNIVGATGLLSGGWPELPACLLEICVPTGI